MTDDFKAFCERLWSSWLAGTLQLTPAFARRFDVDAAPEPYLPFDVGSNPLVAFTTNPGDSLPFQRRPAVLDGASIITAAMDFASAATALAAFYRTSLRLRPAGRRIEALLRLAALVSADGVLQVEAFPFHSRSLPNKPACVSVLDGDPLLAAYVRHLRAFLIPRPIVIVSAVTTRSVLNSQTRLSPWLSWQAGMAGIDLATTTLVPLVGKNGKTTCAAFVSRHGGAPKALVLMMGSNQLPAFEGLRLLGEAFRQSAQAG